MLNFPLLRSIMINQRFLVSNLVVKFCWDMHCHTTANIHFAQNDKTLIQTQTIQTGLDLDGSDKLNNITNRNLMHIYDSAVLFDVKPGTSSQRWNLFDFKQYY